PGIHPAYDVGQDRMEQIVRGMRQRSDRLERRFARAQETLPPLAADAVVVDVAEQSHAIERVENVLLLATGSDAVFEEESLDLFARQNVARQNTKEPFHLQLADERSDLGKVFLRNLRCSEVDDFLEPKLALALLGPKRGKTLADGHQIARAKQRVAADVV